MAFTVVPDKATNDILTEANWDTHIKDNFNTGVPVVLANSTLSGAAASIDFTSISQSWAHLMIVAYLRGDTASTSTAGLMRFNGDTAANYDYQTQTGRAATAAAAETFAAAYIETGSVPANTAGANLFSVNVIRIPHYAQATNNKSASISAGLKYGTATTNQIVYGIAGFWRSNSAITQVTLLPVAGNFNTGSRATLYGLP